MRESSHCFVNNNRACVVISSQLYDRRAIDSPLPTLPLVTSLQHLAYLTSTAPRIREILTLDGGLERLITIVGGCLDLAFPNSTTNTVAGPTSATTSAATQQRPKRRRAVPFKPFSAYENGSDGQDYVNLAALSHTYGFAFQCLVNVGVRGSEQIRTRVVEAGVLQIVSRILSGFLANRRKLQLAQADAEQLSTPVKERSEGEEQMEEPTPRIASAPAPVMITTAPTPVVAAQLDILLNQQMQQSFGHRLSQQIPSIRRTNTPDTLASVDVETDQHSEQDYNENENEAESSGQENEQLVSSRSTGSGHRRARSATIPKLHSLTVTPHSASSAHLRHRRQQNASSAAEDEEDADDSSAPSPTTGPLTTPMEVTQQDGAQQNPIDRDGDVIMNAEAQQPSTTDAAEAEAMATILSTTSPTATSTHLRPNFAPLASSSPSVSSSSVPASLPLDYHFKEDDVLHCLHLLAYLSKYPHVRAVFHDPMNETARPCLPPTQPTSGCSHSHPHSGSSSCSRKKQRCGDNGEACSSACTANHTHDEDVLDEDDCGDHHHSPVAGPSHHQYHLQQHNAADSEDEAELEKAKAMAALPPKERKPALEPSRPPKSTANNVFSLVEQFTHRPSSDPNSSSSGSRSNQPIIKLPADIQYWAGVIMRNACRKDEQKGGIRQCANMSCGVWERFPREFAKCRRCRKAKYCSKSCQRRAWQAGHRYWCSARQDNPPQQPNISNAVAQAADHVAVQIATHAAAPGVEDDDSTTEIRVLGDI